MTASATILTCSICGEPSTDICVYCTKDACMNHRCDRCKRCSDCCDCDVPLSAEPPVVDPIAEAIAEPVAEAVVEPIAEPISETEASVDEYPAAEPADVLDSIFAPEPEHERPRYEPASSTPPDDKTPNNGTTR